MYPILCFIFICWVTSAFQIHPFHLPSKNQTEQFGLQTKYTQFTAYYPDSKIGTGTISLRGDNCNLTWNKGVPLKKVSTNTWSTALLCPENTKISVKALLNDSKWMMGANKIFNVSTSVDVSIFPSFSPKQNPIIDTSAIHSSELNNSRKLSIYYPPSYYDNTLKKYELVILHDGQNLFDPSKAAFGVAWECQNTADQLIVQGGMQEIIIVGIWNTAQRNTQYTYSYDASEKFGGKGDIYLNFISKDVLPLLKNSTLKGRILDEERVTIGGSSLGGLISCYAAYTRPEQYKNAICMSSSFWWNNQDFKSTILAGGQYKQSNFYMDSGDSGPSQDSKNETLGVYNRMKSIGYKQNQTLFYYLDKGGQHNEYYWGKRFWIPLVDLFAPERNL